jgi:hypothetical protein
VHHHAKHADVHGSTVRATNPCSSNLVRPACISPPRLALPCAALLCHLRVHVTEVGVQLVHWQLPALPSRVRFRLVSHRVKCVGRILRTQGKQRCRQFYLEQDTAEFLLAQKTLPSSISIHTPKNKLPIMRALACARF